MWIESHPSMIWVNVSMNSTEDQKRLLKLGVFAFMRTLKFENRNLLGSEVNKFSITDFFLLCV